MELVKEIGAYIAELYPKLHSNGIDLLSISVVTVLMETLKRIWFKKIVYKSIKYHKRRMKMMLLILFVVSVVISVLWNFKYWKTPRLYQIIISSWVGSIFLYEFLKRVKVIKLINRVLKTEEDEN
jgi:hypothetical protein